MAEPETTNRARWHDRTLERSLQNARTRAISRGDRFIRAAASLLRERGRPDFTVQEVVERSEMSLRSFYHHFATKDDLLLALVEESLRLHHRRIRAAVDREEDPVGQLRAFVLTYSGQAENDDPASKGMAIFHLHLAESRAGEYTATLQPQIELLVEIIERGRRSGRIRSDVPADKLALFINHILVSAINMRVLGVEVIGDALTAEDLWQLLEPAVLPGTTTSIGRPAKPAPARAKR